MKISTAILSVLFLSMSNSYAVERVDNNFLGEYRLISNEKGLCAESIIVETKENNGYSLWLTFRDESNNFMGNKKIENINEPLSSSTERCASAGPTIPFCYESKKELTKYDKSNQSLENYRGRKTTTSKAEYSYTKIEALESGLKVTQLDLKKSMAPGAFVWMSVVRGATDTSFFSFAEVKADNVCVYDKQ